MHNPGQKIFAEWLGTALLICTVIGSGIMAEKLAAGNVAIALLGNTLATVCGLYFLIHTLGPVSGAHFNPAVSVAMSLRAELPRSLLLPYIAAQLLGGVSGAWLAHLMFELPVLQFSTKIRTGSGQWLAEAVATNDPRVLERYPAMLDSEYGQYFKVARLFAKVIGRPALMRELSRVGIHSRTLMEWVLRIMANLLRPDEIGPAEAAYKAAAAIVRLAPNA